MPFFANKLYIFFAVVSDGTINSMQFMLFYLVSVSLSLCWTSACYVTGLWKAPSPLHSRVQTEHVNWSQVLFLPFRPKRSGKALKPADWRVVLTGNTAFSSRIHVRPLRNHLPNKISKTAYLSKDASQKILTYCSCPVCREILYYHYFNGDVASVVSFSRILAPLSGSPVLLLHTFALFAS